MKNEDKTRKKEEKREKGGLDGHRPIETTVVRDPDPDPKPPPPTNR